LKGGKVQDMTGLKFADNLTQSRKVGDVSRNERQARFLSFVKGRFASVETDYFFRSFLEKPIDGG
jgi:nucleoid-associated protein YejK